MPPSDPLPRAARRRNLARGLTALAAVALAAASLAEHTSWKRQREALARALAVGGTADRAPEMALDVAREPDRVRAALRAARGLLADELDRGWQAELVPAGREAAEEEGLRKLARAHAIAAESLGRRPASWQASEVLGATRYLTALRQRLPMSPEMRDSWRRPLLAARALGPGQPEPVRFLAAATLSEWPRLAPGEREEAREVLKDAFADPQTFDLLAASWLRIAPSRSAAFAAVPAQPRAWRTVERFYAERADWGPFALAHEQGQEALFERLSGQLEKAEGRLRGGDRRRARWYALEILEKAAPSHRYQPLVARALEILPPGPLGEVRARRMTRWLDWSRELCLLGSCPFSDEVLVRMAGLSQLEDDAAAAAAAEMSGESRRADLLARGNEILGPGWAPYHLLRARRQASAGELSEARLSLARVHRDWHSRAAYLEIERLVAAPAGQGSVPEARSENRRSWPADAWIPAERPVLEVDAGVECSRLELEVLGVSARGSAIEIYWDGDPVGSFAVSAGRRVRLTLPAQSIATKRQRGQNGPVSVHRLEIEPFVHPQLRPGRVRLQDCGS